MFGLPVETIVMLATTIGSFIMKQNAQRQSDMMGLIELQIKKDDQSNKNANEAEKRSSPFLRKTIGFIIIIISFGGLLMAPFFDIPVSIIQDAPQHEFLWGFIKWGKAYNVIQAEGLVYPEWVRMSVMSVVGFVFGSGFSKVSR
jgi:hypothetical protein